MRDSSVCGEAVLKPPGVCWWQRCDARQPARPERADKTERWRGIGGEAGIRTLGRTLRPYNGLANRRLQPLGHLTADCKYTARKNLVDSDFAEPSTAVSQPSPIRNCLQNNARGHSVGNLRISARRRARYAHLMICKKADRQSPRHPARCLEFRVLRVVPVEVFTNRAAQRVPRRHTTTSASVCAPVCPTGPRTRSVSTETLRNT
jgi:hypothetical protein